VNRWRLAATLTVAAVAATVLDAAPAAAHTLTGITPSDYSSRITGITPARPAVRVRLLDLGRRVELRNTGQDEVTVLGYDDEPYLRVGPDGVFENYASRSHFLNQVQPAGFTTTTLPAKVGRGVPEWHRRSRGRAVRWRDRRTRWEGPAPSVVKVDPHHRHVVSRWTIAFHDASGPARVEGTITWVPGPSARGWLVLAAWIALVTVAFTRVGAFAPALGAMAIVLVTADIVHTIGQVAASRDAVVVLVGKVALTAVFSIAAWVAVLLAVPPLVRGRSPAIVAVGISAFFIAMLTGVGDASSLGHSQIPSLLDPVLVRALVTVCLGAGVGLAVAALIVARRAGWWAELRNPPVPSNP